MPRISEKTKGRQFGKVRLLQKQFLAPLCIFVPLLLLANTAYIFYLLEVHPVFSDVRIQIVDKNIDKGTKVQRNKSRACRVILENTVDVHYEVIESIVRYYPLPWNTFNCTISKPILFDFALFDNQFPKKNYYRYIGPAPIFLNGTEFWGWKAYFESNLKGKVVQRSERRNESSTGMSSVKTQAYFNNLVHTNQYDESADGPVDAIIDVSCGIDMGFITRLEQDERKYCLLHGYVPALDDNEYLRSKTCWISPMFPPDHCFFLPLALPPKQKRIREEKELTVCAPGGGGRNQLDMIILFLQIPYSKYNVTLKILTRKIHENAMRVTKKQGMQDRIEWITEKDFVKYFQTISNCDIYVPLTDPRTRPAFFRTGVPGGGKSLSGSIPPIIQYEIPSVMHVELEAIYHEYWTAPVEVYTNQTIDSRAAALSRMVERLAQQNLHK